MAMERGSQTRKRLDDMADAGFTAADIAVACGLDAEAVDCLYDGLACATPAGALAIVRASRQLIPDIDEMVVERIIAGDPPPGCVPNVDERREVVRLMLLDRQSHMEIADRLGATPRTVERIVDRLGMRLNAAAVG
jgi:hypothetical protein